MASTPPKKGPHKTMSCKPSASPRLSDQQIEEEIKAFAEKAQSAIENARSKMSAEERAKADRNADAIFDRASAAAKGSRRLA